MIHHVFDIDRTLADGTHRERVAGFVAGTKPTEEQWTTFCQPELMETDVTYPLAAMFMEELRKDLLDDFGNVAHKISFITGRRDTVRTDTVLWLKKYYGYLDTEVLMMRRPEEEHIKASLYKETAFLSSIKPLDEGIENVQYVFYEDLPSIQRMYSTYGIVVKCPDAWQVMDGDTARKVPEQLSFCFDDHV